jgi:hypothetical protein
VVLTYGEDVESDLVRQRHFFEQVLHTQAGPRRAPGGGVERDFRKSAEA